MAVASKTSVLIVEDHVYTGYGLADALAGQGDITVLGVAGTAAEGLAAAQELSPDLVMLDLHLPDRLPIRQMIKQFCAPNRWPVIIFSAEARPAFIESALKLGARAFLSKSEPPDRVAACIRKVASGARSPIVSAELRQGLLSFSDGLEDVLKLLGRGMKYHEIAEVRQSSPATVRKQCERLQLKLGLSSREQLIAWAVANGYASLRLDPSADLC